VESDINPRFTFSAGQKRVLGLAFLIAVHLSRPWSHLRTLVLDDPVQHIDDYRAMHVIEVLSAINRSGQQIVCAVEDTDLADLLCRRLGNTDRDSGIRIEMEYVPGSGATAVKTEDIAGVPRRVLLTA